MLKNFILKIDIAGCGGWECPENGNQVVMIPNPEDCRSYVVCFGTQEIPMTCGGNLHWSILDQACRPPGEANCPFSEDGEEPMIEEKCPPTGIKAIPNLSSCKSYILCVNGAEVERNCPEGTEFSTETRTCAHPIVAQCNVRFMAASATSFTSSGTCPTITSMNDIVFRPNPDDCQSYNLCLQNEIIVPMRCGHGLHWNAIKNMCMTQDQAHCRA